MLFYARYMATLRNVNTVHLMDLLKPLSLLHNMHLKFARGKEHVQREDLARYHKVRGWHGAKIAWKVRFTSTGKIQAGNNTSPDCWALFACAILGHAYNFMPCTAAKCKGGLSTLNNSPLSFARKNFYMGG